MIDFNAWGRTHAENLMRNMDSSAATKKNILDKIVQSGNDQVLAVSMSLADRATKLSNNRINISSENAVNPMQRLAIWWINSYSLDDGTLLGDIWPMIRQNNDYYDFLHELAKIVRMMTQAKSR